MNRNPADQIPVDWAETHSFEELAAQQGVLPIENPDALLGHPSAEDESVDDFAAMLREWRRESNSPASHP